MVMSHSKLKRKRKDELAALEASVGTVPEISSSTLAAPPAAGEGKKNKEAKNKKQKTNQVGDVDYVELASSNGTVEAEEVQVSRENETKDKKTLKREKKEEKKRKRAVEIEAASHIPPSTSEEDGVHHVENRVDEAAGNGEAKALQPVDESGIEKLTSVREKKGKKKKGAKDRWGVKIVAEDDKEEDPVETAAVNEAPPSTSISDLAEELYDLKKVYVGGFPYSCTEDDIHDYFSECGVISELDCMTFPDTGNFRGIAFITFKVGFSFKLDGFKPKGHSFVSLLFVLYNPSGLDFIHTQCGSAETEGAAAKALEYDGADMGGRFLKIVKCKLKSRASTKDPERGEVEKTLGSMSAYIGNLSWDVTEDAIKNFFRKAYSDTKIDSVRLAFDKTSGDFKGFGHVEFGDDDSLEAAIKMNQAPLLGRPMKIAYSVPPRRSDVNGGNGQSESRSSGTCFNCGEEGHKAFFCPKKGVDANDSKKVAACYSCGEEGHKSFLCPKKKSAR